MKNKPVRKVAKAGQAPLVEQAPAGSAEPHQHAGFPIVGIGASAGGLAAFEAFFSGMPAVGDPGMAFVLVQHLDPDHKSILTELIRRYTRMQVFEVTDGIKVEPNCAYIIPPNHDMAFLNGTLELIDPSEPRGKRLTIDFFFRSLAQDQGARAIGIVLSGTGSDGTMGIRAIKGAGGMVMAQLPASTEFDGMPRSAIATGLVDYELQPAEMPAQLIAYASRAFSKAAQPPGSTLPPKSESALRKVFVLLRDQTGHDFSQYKPKTVERRIERRMAVQQVETLEEYVKYLQQTPAEVMALFRDMLIGVTGFFRDPEAYQALEEQAIPALIADKSDDDPIRIWVPGCSTGEEAYSLAILFQEYLTKQAASHKIQVFATDIDSQAIATARVARYPASIAADISPERLARFFSLEPDEGSYRIRKGIRDLVIFSEHDVIKDPPFSRLDLISCRNLLIYLGADLQKRLIPLFHYALRPGGFLFLGTSETIGDAADLYNVLDRKLKLYRRKNDIHGMPRATHWHYPPRQAAADTRTPPPVDKRIGGGRHSLRELTEQALLQQVAPAGALVNGQGDILYLHGRTGNCLEPTPGETVVSNILKMARDGLRRALTTALHKAVSGKTIEHCPGLRVDINGHAIRVNLTIRPLAFPPELANPSGLDAPLFLVIFEELPLPEHEPPTESGKTGSRPPAGKKAGNAVPADDRHTVDPRITALTQELRAKEEYLQTANEELETSNEELKSSNEEMQSVNEELQSTNEELETSKEELQSVNEELATVNVELQTKVTDLSRANNDMNNLLAGSGIGTIFVDHGLRILRFTPAVTRIINLIQGDVGRPVGHIVSNLKGANSIVSDTQTVLDTLLPREVDVQTTEGKWYTMRIQPYRTLDNVIEGAVITFVDITAVKKARQALQESESRLRQFEQSLPLLVWSCLPDGRSEYLNPQWAAYTGLPVDEQPGLAWLEPIHPEDRRTLLTALAATVDTAETVRKNIRIRHHGGAYRWFDTHATALRDPSGRISHWFGINMDIDDRHSRNTTDPGAGEPPQEDTKESK